VGAPRGCAAAALGELEVAAGAGKARLRAVERAVELRDADVVCVVGAVATELQDALRDFASAGAVLGICEGLRGLVELGLIDVGVGEPGQGRGTGVIEGKATPFTRAIPAGRTLRLGEMHVGLVVGEQAESEGRVLLRACGPHGEPTPTALAVCGPGGNVVAIAAHLYADPSTACGGDGRSLILAALAWKRGTPARIDLGR
jgi:hypothetical protein